MKLNYNNITKDHITTKRDITLIDLNTDFYLVVGCDVSGGIGPKPNDLIQVSGEIVGTFTTRVALMEVISTGASPFSVINTLTTSYQQKGQEILAGIRKQAREVGLSEEMINGSTEDNVNTRETGVGITVIGKVEKDKLSIANTEAEDIIVSLGIPLVGEQVLNKKDKIADLNDLLTLCSHDIIHEIIPVGSKGIKYEAELLAEMSGLLFKERKQEDIDLSASAGPGTVLLASLSRENINKIKDNFTGKPLNIIGKVV